jgi:hypothetical protein
MPGKFGIAGGTKMATATMGTAAISVAAGTTAWITESDPTAARRIVRLVLASTRRIGWLIRGSLVLLLDLGLKQHHSLLHLGELSRKLLLCFVRAGGRVCHLSDEFRRLVLQSLVGSEGTLESVDDLLD